MSDGSVSPFGHSIHIAPACFIRPACSPASAPNPQKKSARTAPRIALPVSCARTSRLSGRVDNGHVVDSQTGVPRGTARGSTAILAPVLSGIPSDPLGPRSGGPDGISRKNTYAGFWLKRSLARSGYLFTQPLIPCIDAWSIDNSPASTSQRPIDRYGWPLWSAKPTRITLPSGSWIRPRSLHLQEEELDRIVDPGDFTTLDRRGAVDDVGAGVIRNQLAAVLAAVFPTNDPAADAPVLELGIRLAQVDGDEIGRRRKQRVAKAHRPLAAALQQRLVVSGDEATLRAIGIGQSVRRKIGFEVPALRIGIVARDARGFGTGVLPQSLRLALERAAGADPRVP